MTWCRDFIIMKLDGLWLICKFVEVISYNFWKLANTNNLFVNTSKREFLNNSNSSSYGKFDSVKLGWNPTEKFYPQRVCHQEQGFVSADPDTKISL